MKLYPTVSLLLVCLRYYTDVVYEVKKKCIDLWNEYFDSRSLIKGIWYKTIQPCLSRSPWFVKSDLSRNTLVTAMRLRSGHIPLNSFAYLMGKIASKNCTECGFIEDVYHILVECIRNEAERNTFSIVYGFNLHEIGVCNSILAYPLSEEAKMLYKLVNRALRRR